LITWWPLIPNDARPSLLDSALVQIRAGGRLWLFLDYDGTLVPIARTPDEAVPDPALLELLSRLARAPQIRTAILSGRPLASLQEMIPLPGVHLAGTYGLEIRTMPQAPIRRVELAQVRPTIERVKRGWAELIEGRSGFLLEDKGLAFALHARFAAPADADFVLPMARDYAGEMIDAEHFRILGGHRFLEVAPAAAHKGQTVEWLLDHEPLPNALPVYFGDDDKDEEAFAVVRKRGGIPIVVGEARGTTQALVRLESPTGVRDWLELVLSEQPLA
jgi:trehalose 6-phosphate phosphatase